MLLPWLITVNSRSKKVVLAVVLWAIFFIFAFVIYRHVFLLYFFQDDFVWLSRARDIQDDWQLIFSTKISGFFMPLIYSYFALVFPVFGLKPEPYYVVNLILHSLNGFLFFWIIRFITTNTRLAFFASLFFLSFSLPFEVVIWISAMAQLVPASLLLGIGLSWIGYLYSHRTRWYVLSFWLTVAMLFTKEWSVLVLPFIGVLTLWYYTMRGNWRKHLNRRILRLLFPWLILFVGYLGFEYYLQTQKVLITEGHYRIGWHVLSNLLSNFLLTFTGSRDLARLLGAKWALLAGVILSSLLLFGWRQWRRRQDSTLLMGISWALLAFGPTALFTWDPFVSRYGYMPSFGSALVVASFVIELTRRPSRLQRTIILSIAAAYIGINAYYIDETITETYLPLHVASAAYSDAISDKYSLIAQSTKVGVYPTIPHPSLILPEVFHAVLDVPRNKIKVLPDPATACPASLLCLRWNVSTLQLQITQSP